MEIDFPEYIKQEHRSALGKNGLFADTVDVGFKGSKAK
jgi:hypothetical protein